MALEQAQLTTDLRRLGLGPGQVVLVHSSLRQVGWVEGGPRAVVDALVDVLGPTGTLVVPTHTGDLIDPAAWTNPPVPEARWPVIRREQPAFRPDTSSWGMGALAETVRKHPSARRSAHPLHSFAALGPAAPTLLDPHPLDYGLGETSPLAKLEALGGRVLLLGVTHAVNTTLHLAEYRTAWAAGRTFRTQAPVEVGGQKRWVPLAELRHETGDFEAVGAAFVAAGRGVQQGLVGEARAQLLDVGELLRFAVAWLDAHRGR